LLGYTYMTVKLIDFNSNTNMMYVLIKFLIMFKEKHINQSEKLGLHHKIYDDNKINLMFKNREMNPNIILLFALWLFLDII